MPEDTMANHKNEPPATPCARALYDYEGEDEDDLQFKEGDLITLIERVDENWFLGELNGRDGIFPENYVEVLVPL